MKVSSNFGALYTSGLLYYSIQEFYLLAWGNSLKHIFMMSTKKECVSNDLRRYTL
jgi:hypothetical protein